MLLPGVIRAGGQPEKRAVAGPRGKRVHELAERRLRVSARLDTCQQRRADEEASARLAGPFPFARPRPLELPLAPGELGLDLAPPLSSPGGGEAVNTGVVPSLDTSVGNPPPQPRTISV